MKVNCALVQKYAGLLIKKNDGETRLEREPLETRLLKFTAYMGLAEDETVCDLPLTKVRSFTLKNLNSINTSSLQNRWTVAFI